LNVAVNGSRHGLDRERILAVAMRHFARFGYRRTSLAEVARELEVVKGALYYHFPGGKAELFDAAASSVEAEILGAMRAAASAAPDALAGLKAIVAAKFDALRAALARMGVEDAVARELTLVPREAEAFHAGERRLLEEWLARGERQGSLRRMRSRGAAAAALQALLREPVVLAVLSPSPPATGARALPPAIYDILFHGLAAPTGVRRAEVTC
jgi:AcrR family transcriptional regulator